MNTTIVVTGLICFAALMITFLLLQYRKTVRMLEADKIFKKYDSSQNLLQEGIPRNRWDLSYFPAISRVFFKADWKIILASFMLVLLGIFYAIFKDNSILDLIKVNVGAVIGTLVGGRDKKNDT